MARSRARVATYSPSYSRGRSGYHYLPRDRRSIATALPQEVLDPVGFLSRAVPAFVSSVRSKLDEFEDRRFVLDDAPARSTRRVVQIGIRPRPSRRSVERTWSAIHFKYPVHTLICVRRKRRRQVLFAKGRGGGGKRPPKYNSYSHVRC